MSGEKDLTYTFNASILTETVVTYTNGTFIGRDVIVRVVKVEGSRVVVEPEPERHPKP